MTTFQLYWLTRLDSLNNMFVSCCIAGGMIAIFGALAIYMHADIEASSADEPAQKRFAGKWLVRWGITSALCGIAVVFVPTTSELVAIYGISYLTQNKDAREIPAEALKVLNQKLKELSKED